MASPDSAPLPPVAQRTGDDDAALMLKFQQERDYAAFESLFVRHKQGFLHFLQSLTGQRAIAEDISQHCWLKLIELAQAERYRAEPGSSFRSFLYTLGRNRFLDEHVRRHEQARRAPVDVNMVLEQAEVADGAGNPSVDPQQMLATAQGMTALLAAMAALPRSQREVIALWAGGASIAEMVEIVGAPRDTVLSRKKYALARLKSSLVEPAEDPP
jgi:RNA polymerase sigma-70 factor (ECF subfamily)